MKRFLFALLCCLILAGCTPTLSSGKVIAKTYVPGGFEYVSNGDGGFMFHSSKYVVVIEGTVDGQYVTNEMEVSAQKYSQAEVGQTFYR